MESQCHRCEKIFEAAYWQSRYCDDCIELNRKDTAKRNHRTSDPKKELEPVKKRTKPKKIMTDAEQKVIDQAVLKKLNMDIDQGRSLKGEEFDRVAAIYIAREKHRA